MTNIFQEIVTYCELNPNQQIFVGTDVDIPAHQFAFVIKHFAANLLQHEIKCGDLLALDIDDTIIALALLIAIGLVGASWIAITPDLHDINLPISKIITNRANNQKVNMFKANPIYSTVDLLVLNNTWFSSVKTLDYIDRSSTDLYMIAQSSGSTGNVKLIPLTYDIFQHRVNDYIGVMLNNVNYLYCFYMPLKTSAIYHSLQAILSGITIVIEKNPKQVMQYDNLYCMGSVFQAEKFMRLLEPVTEPYNAYLDVSGAAVNKQFVERSLQYFKTVYSSYGSTETSRNYLRSYNSLDQYTNSLGLPLRSDSEAEIVDEYNHILPAGKIGMVRLPANFRHSNQYLFDLESSEKCFQHNCFYPGDLGYKDANNNLFITGRSNTNMINISGAKINPLEIEQTIKSKCGISECLLFKNSQLESDRQLSLLLVCDNLDQQLSDIVTAVAQNFGIIAVPRNYYCVDAIPLNNNGKVLRSEAESIAQKLQAISIELQL